MTTATQTIIVQPSPGAPIVEILEVLEDREKSLKLRNVDNGACCFAPKSGLKPYRPGVEGYEREYVLAGWFRSRLNRFQERAFGVLE